MIRVLLAEELALIRGALTALLAGEDDIDVVAALERSDDIVPTALLVQPDVAVIDVGRTIDDGFAAAQKLREALPGVQAVILSATGTTRALRRALDAGIRGFVLMGCPPDLLAESIRRVAAGECAIDSNLASRALNEMADPLTAREREVLVAAAEGASAAEIAGRLCLSIGTVRNYLSLIINKLGARNRIDAVCIAREAGWI